MLGWVDKLYGDVLEDPAEAETSRFLAKVLFLLNLTSRKDENPLSILFLFFHCMSTSSTKDASESPSTDTTMSNPQLTSAVDISGKDVSSSSHDRDAPDQVPSDGTLLTEYQEGEDLCSNDRPSSFVGSDLWNAANTLSNEDLTTVLSRSYKIDGGLWGNDGAGTRLADYDLAQLLVAANPWIGEKLQYFGFFRFDAIELSLRIQATQWHYGTLCISGLPDAPNDYRVDKTNTTLPGFQFLNNNPSLVQATQEDTVEYQMPWPLPQPWVRLNGGDFRSDILKFYIHVAIPLRTLGDDVPVSYSVYARFINPRVSFPWIAQGSTQKRGETKEKTRENDQASTSWMDTIKSAVSTFSDVASVATSVASVAALLDKPTSTAGTTNAVLMPGRDMSAIRGLDHSVRLGADQESQAPIESKLMPTDNPNPTIQDLCSVPSYFAFGSVSTSAATRSKLADYQLSPMTLQSQTGVHGTSVFSVLPTYLGWYTSFFQYWRGSLKLKFYFVTSSFISARLRFVWSPNDDLPASLPDSHTGDYISRVVEVTANKEVSITIPWISDQFWHSIGTDAQYPNEKDLGHLGIYLENPIVSVTSTTVPTISWLGFVSAGKDYQVAKFGRMVYDAEGTNSDWDTLNVGRFQFQSCVWEDFKEDFEPLFPDASFFVDDCSMQADSGFSLCELMKRHHIQILKPVDLDRHFYQLDPWSTDHNSAFNLAPFLCGHMYFRGSFRVKISWSVEDIEHVPIVYGMTWLNKENTLDGTFDTRPRYFTSNGQGTTKYLEFEIPYYNTDPYVRNSYYSSDVTGNGVQMILPTTQTGVFDDIGSIGTAVGDDFAVGWLAAIPPWHLQPIAASATETDSAHPELPDLRQVRKADSRSYTRVKSPYPRGAE